MVPISIRPYRPEDYTPIYEITKRAWRGVTMAELREQRFGQVGGRPWYEHKANGIVAKCERLPEQCLVAEIDGQVVGYATFGVQMDGEVGIVGDNAVDPDWQGRGIGTALVGRAVEALREAGTRILEVSTFEHDTPARTVYERLGFRQIATTVHYAMPAQEADDDPLGD